MTGSMVAGVAPAREWRELASCLEADPDTFFPEGAGRESRGAAIAICCSCAVLADCLGVAMRDPSLVGIWAATDEHDRARSRARAATKARVHPPGMEIAECVR